MSKPTPARLSHDEVANYTAALRKRGSPLIWLDKEMTWLSHRVMASPVALRCSRMRRSSSA